ncbi:MAG: LysM peptidoglycan-binding domain-containing protein [Elainellaceae cyanobacterium]
MAESPRRVLPEVNRRVRTSAAMVGLALSMGAVGALIPRQGDEAAASEPTRSGWFIVAEVPEALKSEPSAVKASADPAPVRTGSFSTPAPGEHIVREGETLWRLSRRYGVSVEEILAANGLTSDSILRVGHSLVIPSSSQNSDSVSRRSAPSQSESSSTAAQPVVSRNLAQLQISTISDSSQRVLKARQEQALTTMVEKRNRLKNSLAELQQTELDNSGTEQRYSSGVVAASEIQPDEPISNEANESVEFIRYQVEQGDTLSTIARAHQLSPSVLIEANQITDPDQLKDDQMLIIPKFSPSSELEYPSALDNPSDSGVSLYRNPSTDEPELSPELGIDESSLSHQIRSGDTIGAIANAYGISQEKVAEINKLDNPNLILEGQKLIIPLESADAKASIPSVDSRVTASSLPFSRSDADANSVATDTPDEENELSLPLHVMVDKPTPLNQLGKARGESTPSAAGDAARSPLDAASDVESSQPSPSEETQTVAMRFDDRLSSSVSQSTSSLYVENLMSEIRALADQYRSEQPVDGQQGSSSTEERVASLPSSSGVLMPFMEQLESSDAINPDFDARPEQSSVSQATLTSSAEQRQATVVADASESSTDSSSNQIATAPLGSQNYVPLREPITGRMVSPELPPMPGPENYLPEGSPIFEGYRWPARGVLTSGYGWRWGRMHRGIDIAAPVGTPVFAAAPGTIEFSGWNSGGYGNMVDIRHPDGSKTRYAHNSRNLVRAGQQVDQGQQIAEMGSTGYSTGPHVHFEVHLPNQGTVNPVAYLPQRGR